MFVHLHFGAVSDLKMRLLTAVRCHRNRFLILRNYTCITSLLKSFLYPLSIRFVFFHLCVTAQKHLRQTSYIILLKDFICWSMGPQDRWWLKRKLLIKVCPGSNLINLGPLNSWLAKNVSRTLMVSNGLVNTVGVNLVHRPIIRFTFSGRRITFFAPARLVDSWSSQAVEFSAAITRCSRIHIQIVTVWASKISDIFSLPATDTLRAFFFHCIIHIC